MRVEEHLSVQRWGFFWAAAALALFLPFLTMGAPSPSDTNWPMFRGNPALTGVASGSLADKLSLLWSFQSGGPVKSSASIVDGRVFIGSGDSNVYALDLTSGKKIWAAKTGGPVDSSP